MRYRSFRPNEQQTLARALYVSCIALQDQQFSSCARDVLKQQLRDLDLHKLANIFADIDVLDDDYRPLSELVLHRKITDQGQVPLSVSSESSLVKS